jgi:CRISPR-associated protein Csm4
MEFSLYKLHFSTALHAGGKNLTDSGNTLSADTIFSALCHEELKIKGTTGIEKLVRLARDGQLLISDALPYINNEYFIPKPIVRADGLDELERSNKEFKALRFIPLKSLREFMRGDINAENAVNAFKGFGESELRAGVNLRGAGIGDDAEPYHVGTYTFNEQAGLYIITGGTDMENLFKALSLSGLGGKRSSGLGKFTYDKISAEEFAPFLGFSAGKRHISLSVSMAKDDELEKAIEDSFYLLQRRSGFISSSSYAETPRKRKDFYCFAAGSSFLNCFAGDVFDCAGSGAHPVYRYAKPLFFTVSE